ncbi:hypothetical protein SAMN04488120_101108 [Fontimonas thermophila]|uniref:Lipoprotein-attachment site-containing protein n=1 Tax=Fontimonas thermophila TaxID=1076937 RepID=A0A1I2H1I5_9GAMM|nr:lipoprotein [Fontimonas thermophila]SFF23945.1 hypothetical protein SAMN04488120_101108 [Fontimonas thermophila]
MLKPWLLTVVALLAACGQAGALYLPDEPAPPAQAPPHDSPPSPQAPPAAGPDTPAPPATP